MIYKLLPGFSIIIEDIFSIITNKYIDKLNENTHDTFTLCLLYYEISNMIYDYIKLFLDNNIIDNIYDTEIILYNSINIARQKHINITKSKHLFKFLTEKLFYEIFYILKRYNKMIISLSYDNVDLIEYINDLAKESKLDFDYSTFFNYCRIL